MFLIAGGFIWSGGFLGIDGYGYGWDKTRTGLLVLVAALVLYVFRHVVQDKMPMQLREEVPADAGGAGRARHLLPADARRAWAAPTRASAQVPEREVGDRRAVALAVERPDEDEPGQQRPAATG